GRYLPLSLRLEQRAHTIVVLPALLSGLQRRICEPIAVVAMRIVHGEPGAHYAPSNAGPEVPAKALVRARFMRQKNRGSVRGGQAKGRPAPYKVLSWVGWHHHVRHL